VIVDRRIEDCLGSCAALGNWRKQFRPAPITGPYALPLLGPPLAFLGIILLRASNSAALALARASRSSEATSVTLFTRCFVIATPNSKGYLFFSAFLPQLVDPAKPINTRFLLSSLRRSTSS
jgi:hypothetical protein